MENGKKTEIMSVAISVGAMLVRIGETTSATVSEQKHKTDDVRHANQVASFDYSERQVAFAAKVRSCVSRAFYAIGAGAQTQDLIYWNLYVTGNVGRDDILDKPAEFIEGVKAIYGEAGIKVFEYMLMRELKREFAFAAESDKGSIQERSASDLLRLIAAAATKS